MEMGKKAIKKSERNDSRKTAAKKIRKDRKRKDWNR
jgi:hypothetical protein